jgi:hypothetical protein
VWATWLLKYLSIVWWLYTSYPFIDASTKGYEEEEVFYEEEEENFDHCTNQGKLYSCKLPKCKLYLSKAPIHTTLCFTFQVPVFILQSFYFDYQGLPL